MSEEVKRIQSAREVLVTNGKRAMLIVFDDGEWTWWYVAGNEDVSALTSLVGHEVLITEEEIQPLVTIH